VTHLKAVLSGVAAIFFALHIPTLLSLFRTTSQEKATGVAVVTAGFVETLYSPLSWLLAMLSFGLLLAASRLDSKALRAIFFWTPALTISTLGFVLSALLTYVIIHFRQR